MQYHCPPPLLAVFTHPHTLWSYVSIESGTMSGGGGKPRGGLIKLGNAAPRAAVDAKAAAKEMAAAEGQLAAAEEQLKLTRDQK